MQVTCPCPLLSGTGVLSEPLSFVSAFIGYRRQWQQRWSTHNNVPYAAMSRSRATTATSQRSHSSQTTHQVDALVDWNWKDLRGTPSRPIKFDTNLSSFKKDELSSDKFSKFNIVLNKIENKALKIRNHYSLAKELDETMSWCDDYVDK